jgi:hypothetical protein
MRSRSIVAAISLALTALWIGPHAARGCTGEQPTFEAAVAGASAIARVVVVEASEYGDSGLPERHRVVRSLKGNVSGEIVLDDPRTNGCGDRIGLYAPVGNEAIVAYGVPFFGATLHVVWVDQVDDAHPVYGSSSIPDGLTTLDDVERAIRATLPDTAVTPTRFTWPGVVGGLLFSASIVLLGRRLTRR